VHHAFKTAPTVTHARQALSLQEDCATMRLALPTVIYALQQLSVILATLAIP